MITSSSFFLFDYLHTQLISQSYHQDTFNYSRKVKHPTALDIVQQSAKVGSESWLLLNKELARKNSQAALRLGTWYKKIVKTSNKEEDKIKAIMWLNQAIRLGNSRAYTVLSQLYYEYGEYDKVQQLLLRMPQTKEEQLANLAIALLRIKTAIATGELNEVTGLLNALTPKFAHQSIKKIYHDMVSYQVVKPNPLIKVANINRQSLFRGDLNTCIASIQLFATSLENLLHIDNLLDEFYQKKTLSRYACFPKPRYININLLECYTEPQKAISCNESIFKEVSEGVNTKHIGLMLDSGGANVHFGILYFDKSDDVNVLSHEISHLLGFVDEYPIAAQHDICQARQQNTFAHNIAILPTIYRGNRQNIRKKVLSEIAWGSLIADTTPILQKIQTNDNAISSSESRVSNWLLGTPDVYQDSLGIFPAETCSKSSIENSESSVISEPFRAYKPIKRHTHLHYYSYGFPKEYDDILRLAPKAYQMPSFYYNIALAAYLKGDNEEARKSLAKSLIR